MGGGHLCKSQPAANFTQATTAPDKVPNAESLMRGNACIMTLQAVAPLPAEALEPWQRPVPGGMQQRHIDEGLVLYGNKARLRRFVQVSNAGLCVSRDGNLDGCVLHKSLPSSAARSPARRHVRPPLRSSGTVQGKMRAILS